MFQKQSGSNYYVVGDSTESDGKITFSGMGIVINRDTKEINVFGGARTWPSSTKKTTIPTTLTDAGSIPTINGQAISTNLREWTTASEFRSSTGALTFYDGSMLMVQADKPGVVIYQSPDDLIAVSFKFQTETIEYETGKIPKGYSSVHFNDTKYIPGTDLFSSMFTLSVGRNRDVLKLRDGIDRTDNFYVEYTTSPNESKVVEFLLKEIQISTIQYSTEEKTDASIIFQDYYGSIQGDVVGDIVIFLRSSRSEQAPDNIQQVKLIYQKVNPTVLQAQRIVIPYYHKNQVVSVDYSQWSNITLVSDLKSNPLPQQQVVSEEVQFNIQLDDGSIFKSTVFPTLIPYKEEYEKLPMYFTTSLRTCKFSTDTCYMINGEIYLFGTNSAPQSVVESDTSSVSINFNANVKSYGSYENGLWKMREAKVKPLYNKEYNYMLFTATNHAVDLNTFGVASRNSDVKFYLCEDGSDPKLIKHSMLNVEVASDATPSTLVAISKILVKVDVFEHTFTINFFFERFAKYVFNIPDDPNFPSNGKASGKASSLTGKSVFGNFIFTDSCLAYGVSIDNNAFVDSIFLSADSALYPILNINSLNVATVIQGDNGCDLNTGILVSDIDVSYTTFFNRLNNCTGIVVGKGKVSVPKNSGTCFFRADNTIYLYRPETLRSVGVDLSRGSSAASSTAGTPVNDTTPNPPISATASLTRKASNMKPVVNPAMKPSAVPALSNPPAKTAPVLMRGQGKSSGFPVPQPVVAQATPPVVIVPFKPAVIIGSKTTPMATTTTKSIPSITTNQPTPTITKSKFPKFHQFRAGKSMKNGF